MKNLSKTTLYKEIEGTTFSINIFYNPMARFLPLFQDTERKLYEAITVEGQENATLVFESYRKLGFSLRIDKMTISTIQGKKYFTQTFTHKNF